MALLFAIIAPSIIAPIIAPIQVMAHGFLLYAIIAPIIRYYSLLLFAIIVHYFSYYSLLWQGVGTRKMGMCRQQFLTQSWRNDSLVSNKNACSTASTGRRADRMESCLMERSGTIIRIIVPIIRIICLG